MSSGTAPAAGGAAGGAAEGAADATPRGEAAIAATDGVGQNVLALAPGGAVGVLAAEAAAVSTPAQVAAKPDVQEPLRIAIRKGLSTNASTVGAEALRQAMLAAGVDSWKAMMPILKAHNDALPKPHTAQAKEEGIDKAFIKKANEMLQEFPYHAPDFWVCHHVSRYDPRTGALTSPPLLQGVARCTDAFPLS